MLSSHATHQHHHSSPLPLTIAWRWDAPATVEVGGHGHGHGQGGRQGGYLGLGASRPYHRSQGSIDGRQGGCGRACSFPLALTGASPSLCLPSSLTLQASSYLVIRAMLIGIVVNCGGCGAVMAQVPLQAVRWFVLSARVQMDCVASSQPPATSPPNSVPPLSSTFGCFIPVFFTLAAAYNLLPGPSRAETPSYVFPLSDDECSACDRYEV